MNAVDSEHPAAAYEYADRAVCQAERLKWVEYKDWKIARLLNERKIPAPSGASWTEAGVRHICERNGLKAGDQTRFFGATEAQEDAKHKMLRLHEHGLTLQTIATVLNQIACKPKRAKEWNESNVGRGLVRCLIGIPTSTGHR